MSKKSIIISLICLTLVGAFFAVLACNMFFSDVANLGAGISRTTMLITLPAAGILLTVTIAIMFILRWYKHPDCFKRLARLYLIYVLIFNAIGLVGNVVGAITIYHSFVSPNPFPGYTIIFLVLEVILLAGGVYGLIKLKDVKEDEGKIKISAVYVLKSAGWFLFILLLLNRFGSFLGMPFYVYLRNLYKTFPFYLYLLLPLFLGVLEVLYILKLIPKKPLFILTLVSLGLNVSLFSYIIATGASDSGFISSLSGALPLERLATMPMEMLIHFLAYIGVSAALLTQNKKALD